jgi:hypothetical protein
MKVTIDKLQISDDNLIIPIKLYKGSAIAISKNNRNLKAIVTRKFDYFEGTVIDTMLPTLIFSNNFENFDFYKIGEIKLTIEI